MLNFLRFSGISILCLYIMGCTTTIIREEAAPLTKADLTATAYPIIQDDNTTMLVAKISNIGGTDVPVTANGVIEIYVDHMNDDLLTYTFPTLHDKDFLISGQASAFSIINYNQLSPGEHFIVIHVDSTNVVEEEDETNNRVTRNFTVQ